MGRKGGREGEKWEAKGRGGRGREETGRRGTPNILPGLTPLTLTMSTSRTHKFRPVSTKRENGFVIEKNMKQQCRGGA